ncbi:HNH endonuclease signature motif containing protein [Luteipulveratus mongoliensis]|uniref:HNH endonuclease signature motif containing protein n=1 Tax=Luteipulveratus mongoliensis TaxID=571913 RepID=UPI00069692B9|nr:HNH endonuclease signature motif containing protein [Luteipulveratus mongoliensis]
MAVQTPAAPVAAHFVGGTMHVVASALSRVDGAPLWALSGPDVEDLIESVAAARAALDRIEVAAVREGLGRGLHTEHGYGAVDWVRWCQRAGGAAVAEPAHLSRISRVAGSADRPAAQAIWAQFRGGHLSLGKTDQLARFEQDVTPVAAAEEVEAVVAELVDSAIDGPAGTGLTPRDLAKAVRYAGALLKPERDVEAEHEALIRGRSLTKRPGPAGLAEYRLLADPDAAAIVDAAVAGLSAPVSGPDGEPDPRTPSRRRADALVDVIRRGVSSPGDGPRSTKAQVVATMTLDQLIDGLRGAGVTATGEVLSPAEVRRHACDAGIIPMVLGSRGEVLDVGAEVRLFTSAQRRALWHRDDGCTYPGCTIPPQWCDAHHVVWWSRGGATDLGNAALLCGRHHTLVHRRNLTATVTLTGVVWDLASAGHT